MSAYKHIWYGSHLAFQDTSHTCDLISPKLMMNFDTRRKFVRGESYLMTDNCRHHQEQDVYDDAVDEHDRNMSPSVAETCCCAININY